jgi:hypothetical protein
LAYKWSSSVPLIVAFVLLASGCDESLPPRSDPTNILQASFDVPLENVELKDGMLLPYSGRLSASIKNTYTEVLQQKADIKVSISIWMANAPENHGTVVLTQTSLANPPLSGGQLTLLPHDSAHFVTVWNQHTDSGEPFWKLVPMTWKLGPNGELYQQSEPIEFVTQASIQVFENVQPRLTPVVHYFITYRLFWSSNGNG